MGSCQGTLSRNGACTVLTEMISNQNRHWPPNVIHERGTVALQIQKMFPEDVYVVKLCFEFWTNVMKDPAVVLHGWNLDAAFTGFGVQSSNEGETVVSLPRVEFYSALMMHLGCDSVVLAAVPFFFGVSTRYSPLDLTTIMSVVISYWRTRAAARTIFPCIIDNVRRYGGKNNMDILYMTVNESVPCADIVLSMFEIVRDMVVEKSWVPDGAWNSLMLGCFFADVGGKEAIVVKALEVLTALHMKSGVIIAKLVSVIKTPCSADPDILEAVLKYLERVPLVEPHHIEEMWTELCRAARRVVIRHPDERVVKQLASRVLQVMSAQPPSIACVLGGMKYHLVHSSPISSFFHASIFVVPVAVLETITKLSWRCKWDEAAIGVILGMPDSLERAAVLMISDFMPAAWLACAKGVAHVLTTTNWDAIHAWRVLPFLSAVLKDDSGAIPESVFFEALHAALVHFFKPDRKSGNRIDLGKLLSEVMWRRKFRMEKSSFQPMIEAIKRAALRHPVFPSWCVGLLVDKRFCVSERTQIIADIQDGVYFFARMTWVWVAVWKGRRLK